MIECCNECDYWEDRAELNIDNEVKELQLSNVFAKKNLVTKLTNLKAPSGKHKAKGVVDKVNENHVILGNDSSDNTSKVGTNSSQ
tara:strand:- start:1565 stop:1819 length:255 start_codon:yes stop_codon:yes gene_type:complete